MRSGGLATFSSAMEGATRYHSWILSRFRPFLEGAVLEVGFGHTSVSSLLPPGTRYIGVDRDPEIIARARAVAPAGTYIEADVGDRTFVDRVGAASVDAVLCVNVLEHVPDDRGAVRNLLEVLKPGGHLLLFVPAFLALYNSLDRLAGHERRYTRKSLEERVPTDLGVVLKNDYFNPLGAVGWWLNGFLDHGSLEDPEVNCQVKLFERLVLPFSRFLDPATRRLFGQSVVCAIERR